MEPLQQGKDEHIWDFYQSIMKYDTYWYRSKTQGNYYVFVVEDKFSKMAILAAC